MFVHAYRYVPNRSTDRYVALLPTFLAHGYPALTVFVGVCMRAFDVHALAAVEQTGGKSSQSSQLRHLGEHSCVEMHAFIREIVVFLSHAYSR